MGYLDLGTFATNDILTAADMTQARDNDDWLAVTKPRARVYNSAAFSVPNNASTAVTFDSERVDVGACHSTVTNTSRLTVPTGGGGFYLMGGCILFASNATGRRSVAIHVNGTTSLVQNQTSPFSGNAITLSCMTGYQLAAGDYIELFAFQDSGGALNATASASISPELWFVWQAT